MRFGDRAPLPARSLLGLPMGPSRLGSCRSRSWEARWPPLQELLEDEGSDVTAFVERALTWLVRHGVTARRLMTDSALSYVRNRSPCERLTPTAWLYARRPIARTNGKVERFRQTMPREWHTD